MMAVFGALVASCSSGGSGAPATITFSARPVLCFAPPASATAAPAPPGGLPSCAPSHAVTEASLHVAVAPKTYAGYTATLAIPPDPSFTNISSTTPAEATSSDTVLLGPAASNPAKVRYVLGPARLSRSQVVSATAYDEGGTWVDNVVLTTSGAKGLGALEAQQFHAMVAFVVDNKVLVPTVVEPTQRVETPPGAVFQLFAGLDKGGAQTVASELSGVS